MCQLSGKAAIVPSAGLVKHHADCDYPFRQDSDFWYLTGFDEPDAIALFLSHKPIGEQFILFVAPKNPRLEVWHGLRCGVDEAVERFGADISHPIEEFSSLLKEYLGGSEGLVFQVGKNPKIESIVLTIWSNQLDDSQRIGSAPSALIPTSSFLDKMRLIKDSWEIERITEAVHISAQAHEIARQNARAGINERNIQAIIEKYFLDKGTRGPAYGSIVASGDNACILHYMLNNDSLKDGDLLLIDAGCSLVDYYNGDITRTFPVNGKFSPEQLALYEIVLEAQQSAIKLVSPGQNAEIIHMHALQIMVEGFIDLGLLKGSIEEIIDKELYKHLYMHRTGHWLGLDVHDVGAYRLGDHQVELKSGMILTVEPGVYISDRLPIPEGQPEIDDRWKGIGIRIEDDVLVTENSQKVLSEKALKSVKDMEN